MSAWIKTLKDVLGNQILPRTVARAVKTEGGESVENVLAGLGGKVDGITPGSLGVWTKEEVLAAATRAAYGLGAEAVPDAVLGVLAKAGLYNGFAKAKYTKKTATTSSPDGTVFFMPENGKLASFIVAKQNYENSGRALIVRTQTVTGSWNTTQLNEYAGSAIDTYMQNYILSLDVAIQQKIVEVSIPYTTGKPTGYVASRLSRKCFSLSMYECGKTYINAPNEGTNLPTAAISSILTGSPAWTRTPLAAGNRDAAIMVWTNNVSYEDSLVNKRLLLPAFTLPPAVEFTWFEDASGNAYPEQAWETDMRDILGNLITLPSAQLDSRVQIATGYYVGTGTFGVANKNQITFPFEPFLVLCCDKAYGLRWNTSGWSTSFIWFEPNTAVPLQASSYVIGAFERTEKTLSWSANDASAQLNGSGRTYLYVGIGG